MAVISEVKIVANISSSGIIGADVTSTQTVTLMLSSLVIYVDCTKASSDVREQERGQKKL